MSAEQKNITRYEADSSNPGLSKQTPENPDPNTFVEAIAVVSVVNPKRPAHLSSGSKLNALQALQIPSSQESKKVSLWSALPSWLISTAIHVGVILILAAWNVEPIQKELGRFLVAASDDGNGDELEEAEIDDSSAQLQTSDSESQSNEARVIVANITQPDTDVDFSEVVSSNIPSLSLTNMTQSLVPSSSMSSKAAEALRAGLGGRSKEAKRELLSKYGGTSETEKAVAMALKWLSQHQDPRSGSWSLAHSNTCRGQCENPGNRQSSNNAATGLALMCFLGAGQTHLEGEYKENVLKGLGFLIKNMKFQKGRGQWYVGDGHKGLDDMYAHGIATIAMCEAYGMTRDPGLVEAAKAGVNFLAYAQNPATGGWHYAPQGRGDTSIVGWQMMALKSAAMSGLPIDIGVVRKANLFLDQMSWGDSGQFYHYDYNSIKKQSSYNANTTSCAVLCRMYSGFHKDHPSIKLAIEQFSKDGPSPTKTYYNYYATQVMKQVGGPDWEKWNVRMRDKLVASQVTTGHAAGSWFWNDGSSSAAGGRLYITCMSTMMLEVYYRYMPLYAEQNEEDVFKL